MCYTVPLINPETIYFYQAGSSKKPGNKKAVCDLFALPKLVPIFFVHAPGGTASKGLNPPTRPK
jgi:hypothetical protein